MDGFDGGAVEAGTGCTSVCVVGERNENGSEFFKFSPTKAALRGSLQQNATTMTASKNARQVAEQLFST
jgi:hypothetical protein